MLKSYTYRKSNLPETIRDQIIFRLANVLATHSVKSFGMSNYFTTQTLVGMTTFFLIIGFRGVVLRSEAAHGQAIVSRRRQ